MKMIRTLLLMCFLPLFAWQVNSQVSIYSGTSLPTEQDWTEQRLDATVNSIAATATTTATGGVLNLTSTNATDQFSQLNWYRTDLDFDFLTGFTLEVKAKVTTADKTGAFNIQGFDKWGKGFRVGILSNAVTEQTDQFAATNILASGLTNGDNFHTYLIVIANYQAEVFRDGVSLGTFPLKTFKFDNIIENGGFEDSDFPDFMTPNPDAFMDLTTDPLKKRYGNQALEMDNAGVVTDGWSYIENARTRNIAIKPNTSYDIAITRRRTANEPWAWRDMGAFYDTQLGVLNGVDDRGNNAIWAGTDRMWQVHNQTITTPEDAKSIHFEFPSWIRDGNKFENTTSFDNFTLREDPGLTIGDTTEPAHGFPDVVFPNGYVNLIHNGDFEDHTTNNDGTYYEWALASSGGDTDNTPYAFNSMWNGNVRIQDKNKPDDFNDGDEFYAHSGINCLRFTTDDNNHDADNTRNFDFTVPLEAGKTYCFNFWHRSPKWPDSGWIYVRIGESDPIWGQNLSSQDDWWINCNLVFTTTAENNTLHLYTNSDGHGNWLNVYFDDFVLYEIPAGTPSDPQIEGKTNLIANGDFEDVTVDNAGQPYTWALASEYDSDDDNYPVAWSDIWGSYVRLQDKQKPVDTGINWAHSGTRSLRFSYLNNWDPAQTFESLVGQGDYALPSAYRTDLNFKKDLEPNKTYTFVFWLKEANYGDRGTLNVANGDVVLWNQELSTKYVNWARQSITFSTTEANHTLRMFTELGDWLNFYLDDLFLYEEPNYVPAPESNGTTYLSFGKSTGTSSTNVDIQSIIAGSTGLKTVNAASQALKIYPNPVVNGTANIDNLQGKGQIEVYSIVGTIVKTYNITGATTPIDVSTLPAGTYIVKADGKNAVMLKK